MYAAGSESFDVGSVSVLSLRTDRSEYEHTSDTVVSLATLLVSRETSASVEWYVDGASVASQIVSLPVVAQSLSMTLPALLAPGRHTVSIRVVADDLSSHATADFEFATKGPDLLAGTPYIYAQGVTTTTISTYVFNRGGEPVPATTLHLFDGDPSAGGELIAERLVPPLPAKDSAYQHTEKFSIPWSVVSQGGLHDLYAVADAGDVIQETNEENNLALAERKVPSLGLTVSTDKEMYEPGEPVSVTVQAANLQVTGTLHITMTTTADLLGFRPFEVVETLAIPAGAVVEREYTWVYTATRGGEYVLVAQAEGPMGTIEEYTTFVIQRGAEFVATPLEGAAPLTVTFTDLSSPWGWVDEWQWDFGDSSPVVTETNPVHVYTVPGSYSVTLTATVGISTYVEIKPDYITVLPGEEPPQVEAGPDQTVNEGDVVVFTGTISDPDSPFGHTILWRFDDGATAADMLTPIHIYADDGVYAVTLTVTDTVGRTGSDGLFVTVENIPPDVNAGSGQTVDEGQAVHFSGTFSDPGLSDTHIITWDFGDGTTASDALTPMHIYADDDGGIGSDTLIITVGNVAPVAAAGPDRSVNEGAVVAFSGVFTDPSTLDTHAISWDLGDGTSATDTLTPEHAYADDGVYVVILTVTDDDGGAASDVLSVTVENVPPGVEAGPDQVITKGEAVQFSGVFTDVGLLDTHTLLWDFGDGDTVTGTLTPEHTYASDGTYAVTLAVTDDDGGVGSDVVRIVVLSKPEFEAFEIERADFHWWGRRGD